MQIAYIILAHKNPGQIERLVKRLNHESVSFFIHIDKKTNREDYELIKYLSSDLSNIYFLPRYLVYWGDFGDVQAVLHGIDEILKSKIPFENIVLISGQDYPIKQNNYILQFFKENGGKSYISYHSFPMDWDHGGFDRIEHWHFRIGDRRFVYPEKHEFKHPYLKPVLDVIWSTTIRLLPLKRRFPKGYQPYGGSQWWCFSRECAQYVNKFVTENRAFVNFFKYVKLPDEIFFQTILVNSPLSNTLENDNLRYIDWERKNENLPAILRIEDLSKLITSPKLYARKFDTTIDNEVLNLIDREILDTTS